MSFTLVFIPGLVSDYRAWVEVAENCEVKGLTTGIADISSGESLSKMAALALNQFDGNIIPVGHSMGGRVAMEMARVAPDRLTAMVLVATGAHPLAYGEPEKRERVIELANSEGMQTLCDEWLPPMLAPGTKVTRPDIYRSLEAMVIDAGAEMHERQIRALVNRTDARPILENLKLPTLFVAGEYDGWSPPDQHYEMAALVNPGLAHVDVLEGAGHFLQVEKPAEFTKILLKWLKFSGSR